MTGRTLPIDLVQVALGLARRQGWDVNPLLARAGVSPMLVAQGQARVTEDQLVQLVRALWDQTDAELFGTGAHPLPRGTFQLLLYGVAGAADVADALSRLQRFIKVFPTLRFEVSSDPEETTISVGAGAGGSTELLYPPIALAAGHRLLSWAVRERIRPRRIEIPFPRAHEEAIASLFGAPIVFDAPTAAIVLDTPVLRRPLMRSESEVEEMVATAPRVFLTLPRETPSHVAKVRRAINSAARPGFWPSAEDVASRLAVSTPTLRRQLAEEGTSYRALSEQVRRDEAIRSLVEGTESIAALSERLGFSEPSAFSRAFRRWTGDPPATYRTRVDPGPGSDAP